MQYDLIGKGLTAGMWDFDVDRILSSGSQIYYQPERIRVCLVKNSTWQEILKNLPKGTLIKKFIKMR